MLVSGPRRGRAADQDFRSRIEDQFFPALDVNRTGAHARAKNRAYGSAFAATRDAADDRAERAATDAAGSSVFRPAAGFDVAFFVDTLDALTLVNLLDLSCEAAGAAV